MKVRRAFACVSGAHAITTALTKAFKRPFLHAKTAGLEIKRKGQKVRIKVKGSGDRRGNGTVKHKSLVSLSPFVGCAPTVADGTVNTLMFLYGARPQQLAWI